ncbi:MAG TPA: holo-ACP synthase [Syntrophomonadaceae bacterium]|jgi:holo-[acyl-carrier protein] synthase|nr:holo-ACP synthase [Syntrophomonadaceae bacterium]
MLVGIDIVDIDRIRAAAARTPRFLERVFTAGELDYCRGKADPFPSLAARFAAREAVRKLDPVFITGVSFQDTEVVVDPDGKPRLVLHGRALEESRRAGINNLVLSLSHSRGQAIAIVIADKE